MRRWPRSTYTMMGMMATMTTMVTTVRITLPLLATEEISEVGRPLMMFAKMMSDIPLPIPRWVMTSPSHMITMAPTSIVKTTMKFSRPSAIPMFEKLTP